MIEEIYKCCDDMVGFYFKDIKVWRNLYDVRTSAWKALLVKSRELCRATMLEF